LHEGKAWHSASDLGAVHKSQGSKSSVLGKLLRAMKELNGTMNKNVALSTNDLKAVKWYVDTSFAVHPDFKSHTGAVMMSNSINCKKTKDEHAE
jgi:hypothetical protein